MPETRLRKARASLPAGYQFGDARGLSAMTPPLDGPGADYRDQHAAAVDRSHDANMAGPMPCQHRAVVFDHALRGYVCLCGAVLDELGMMIGAKRP